MTKTSILSAVHINVRGIVQGVGFRPFIYRLAIDCQLCGFVRNTPEGVLVEAEGMQDKIDDFVHEIRHAHPVRSRITQIHIIDILREFEEIKN